MGEDKVVLQRELIRFVAELERLAIVEPEEDASLARAFELLKLVDKDPIKQAMLLATKLRIRPRTIARWMMNKEKPSISERKRVIKTVAKLIDERKVSSIV